MDEVEVGWSAYKHGLTEADILHAWQNSFAELRDARDGSVHIAIGPSKDGTLVEILAERRRDGSWYIFHAMVPPTKNVMTFLGLE